MDPKEPSNKSSSSQPGSTPLAIDWISKRGLNGFASVSPRPLPAGFSPLPQLPSLPEVLKFPLKTSISEPEPTNEGTTQRSKGLFEALIGDPGVLYQDYLSHPDLFDDETVMLLTELVTRQKLLGQLTDEEQKILDRATIVSAQYSPKPKSSEESGSKVPSHLVTTTDPGDEEPEVEWQGNDMRLAPPTAPVDIPNAPTKWWDK